VPPSLNKSKLSPFLFQKSSHLTHAVVAGVISKRMRTSLVLIIWLISVSVHSAESAIFDFVSLVKSGSEIYKDRDYANCKIIKIERDLDADTDIDYLLSSDCPYGDNGGWGNGGGEWQLYFNENNSFKHSGSFILHPLAFQTSPTRNSEEFYLSTYIRKSCCEGTFQKEKVTSVSRELVSSQDFKKMDIEGSDGYIKYHELFSGESPASYYCLLEDIENDRCNWKNGY